MTISKLTNNVQPLDEVDKINELVDEVNGSQPLLVSGTNIKTINNNSILGSGDLALDGLPSQAGNNGKFLTTNGTAASWVNVDNLPSQTGHAGDLLSTNGSSAYWVGTSNIYPVVETYSNNGSWYRVYSDGWCEQGGSFSGTTNTKTAITFLKTFASTDYCITCSGTNSSNSSYNDLAAGWMWGTKTSTGVSLSGRAISTNGNCIVTWKAEGYIEV